MCRTAKNLILTLLALQFAIGTNGLHVQAMPRPVQPASSSDMPCPEHASPGHGGLAYSLPSHQHAPARGDCCRAPGAQCHCAYFPALPGNAGLSAVLAASPHRLTMPRVLAVLTSPDELFRPPIA